MKYIYSYTWLVAHIFCVLSISRKRINKVANANLAAQEAHRLPEISNKCGSVAPLFLKVKSQNKICL